MAEGWGQEWEAAAEGAQGWGEGGREGQEFEQGALGPGHRRLAESASAPSLGALSGDEEEATTKEQ